MSAQAQVPPTAPQKESAPVQLVLNIQLPNPGDPNQTLSMEELQKQIALQVAALASNPQIASAVAPAHASQQALVGNEQNPTVTQAGAPAAAVAAVAEIPVVQAAITEPAAQPVTTIITTNSTVAAQAAAAVVQTETSATTTETTSTAVQTAAAAAVQCETQTTAGAGAVQVTVVQTETTAATVEAVAQTTANQQATVNTQETAVQTDTVTTTETVTVATDATETTETTETAETTETTATTAAEAEETNKSPVPEKKVRPPGDGPRKRALIIGINYIGTENELGGCIADARNIEKLLKKVYGYVDENIRVLSDDQEDTANIPTKENIYSAIEWMLDEGKANDAFFFYYSGHGSKEDDTDGDEVDGQDEAIFPSDGGTAGCITDDELNTRVVQGVPHGARLTAVFDSCYSGSVMDLPYMYSLDGKLKSESLLRTATKGLLSAGLSYMNGETSAYDSLTSLGGHLITIRQKEYKNKFTKSTKADVVMFSGCRDDQCSYVAFEENKSVGAVTYAFIKSLEENPNPTYRQLLSSIREILHIRYNQLPEFSASHEVDFDTIFAA